ncbi:hypothetical protein PG993_009324 [Apiospora rasikravindrae]|uniref:Uncharacterized protein n=1 Tax=Apiospora rasikravindrae TaxID=990691 RepID=A0ABR1SJ79_9PEZI
MTGRGYKALYPTTSEWFRANIAHEREATRSYEIRTRVRFNDVTQPYYYKDEYLRTHYFLQREDGVTNLRKSISDFTMTTMTIIKHH